MRPFLDAAPPDVRGALGAVADLDRRLWTIVAEGRAAWPGLAVEPVDVVAFLGRQVTPELAEAVRLAHNDAFATHWGSTARSPQQWADFLSARSTRAADSRVLRGGDGSVLAYTITGQWVDRELYINLLGTRQSARGHGLGRAVLEATIAAAADSGRYDLVELGVHSDNPSGAGRLYASVGFTPIRTAAVYAKVEDYGAAYWCYQGESRNVSLAIRKSF